ncbi:pleckstrin homology domain-containing family G member 1-like, partial [Ctenocephalides felis]|uniref:pleckstrin homology domain-containing family G member 1-like n=1 Tax=Ctenocephalides felis TaxID=7515 RepID=UPI000E6E4169
MTENDPVKIAKCFIDSNDGFEVYTKYCTNYPQAIALLTELLQSMDTASLLRNTQSSLGHNLPLGSFLLKPVQRIMKYHLLLQNLYKHYENIHIEKASKLMTDVAHHIDEVKRHLEQQSRVQELEGSLDGWLGPSLTVLGELCLEGTLQERNHKSRQVFLFEKMLLITKRKEDGRLAYKSHIMCSNLMLVEVIQGEPTSFHVIPYDNPRNQITLQARSVQQKKQWGLQLKRLMLEQFNGKIPTRAKDLVLGIDAEESLVALPGVKPDSTPDYLQRRHERRRTEMSMRRLNKNRKFIIPTNLSNDQPVASPEGNLSKLKPDTAQKPEAARCRSEPGIPSEFYETTITDSVPRIPRPPISRLRSNTNNSKSLLLRIGERFANLDYADPTILFQKSKTTQNCDSSTQLSSPSHVAQSCAINNDFYEKSVEYSLESDFFRDSAIYSDDNNPYNKTDDVDAKSDSLNSNDSPVNNSESPVNNSESPVNNDCDSPSK